MNRNLAIGAALGGSALLGALAVAYSNAQGDKSGQSVKAGAPTTTAFDGAEEEAIRTIVRNYLLEHPDILVDSLNAYSERKEAEDRSNALATARKNLAALVSPDHGFVAGANPAAAQVAVIELFDYHCGYCKKAVGLVRDLTKSDPAVKVVFRELPILREESEYAAKAALASRAQGKYYDLHFAMMGATGILTKERIAGIAKEKGVDLARLEADINSKVVKESIEETDKVARDLRVDGTPTFIVASLNGEFIEVIPGFSAEKVMEAVAAAKKSAKKK
ncbi:MAG: DsbA family protein [Parvularculaceae bacterium]